MFGSLFLLLAVSAVAAIILPNLPAIIDALKGDY
jgi:hypothetical protein